MKHLIKSFLIIFIVLQSSIVSSFLSVPKNELKSENKSERKTNETIKAVKKLKQDETVENKTDSTTATSTDTTQTTTDSNAKVDNKDTTVNPVTPLSPVTPSDENKDTDNQSHTDDSNNKEIKWEIPEIYKTQEPVKYCPPDELNQKPTLPGKDLLNPDNLPELKNEYPDYDAFPNPEKFYLGKARKDVAIKKLSKEELIKKLNEEYNMLKKEIFDNDEEKIKKLREENKAYSPLWLKYQLAVSRVLELEDIIKSKKETKKTDEKKK